MYSLGVHVMKYKARLKALETKTGLFKKIDPMVYECLEYMYSNAPRKRSEEEIKELKEWMNNRPENPNPSPAYLKLKQAYGRA